MNLGCVDVEKNLRFSQAWKPPGYINIIYVRVTIQLAGVYFKAMIFKIMPLTQNKYLRARHV